MARTACIVGALIAALAATPAAAVTVLANVSANILDSASASLFSSPVVVTIPMGMPTVRGSTTGALFVGSMPSMGMGGTPMMGLELLTVRRDSAESAAVTAPGSFMVMRIEGTDSMMLRTNAAAEFGVMGDGVLMGGALMGGWASSIDVGRQVRNAATATAVTPSANRSMLVVVVQYN